MISETLKLLLKTSKSNISEPWTWETVANSTQQLYGYKLDLVSSLLVCLKAYKEACDNPLFELSNTDILNKMITAPVSGFNSLSMFPNLDKKYSLEEFYNCMIKLMIGELRITKVDWCKEEVFGYDINNQKTIDLLTVADSVLSITVSEDVLPSIQKIEDKKYKSHCWVKFKTLEIGQTFYTYGDQHLNYDYPRWCECTKIGLTTGKELDGISFCIDQEDTVYFEFPQ